MTTINELPQGWQWVKLGDVTGIFAGYSFNSDDFFIGKGVKCIKITNVGVKKLIETEEVLPNYFREKYVNFLVKENDLIIALTRPYIEEGLKIAICTNNYNDSLLNQRVAVIRDISKINFIYLYFFMTSDIVLNFYQKKFKTANLQPNLRLCDLTELNIPLPPLTEQQRLANLLTEKLNIIEQAKQAIDAQLKAAEDLTAAYLREVFESEEAKTWELVKFEEIADFKNGINFNASQKGSGLLTIDVFNMYSNSIYIENNNDFYRISGNINEEYFLKDNDILFVRSSVKKEGVGWTTLFKSYSENVTFCGFIIRARMKIDSYQEFIVFYFRSPLIRQEIIGKAGSSTITNISQENLKSFLIPLPPIEKQKQLADYLTEKLATVEQLKTALKTQREAINQLPAALLKQAFNGQL